MRNDRSPAGDFLRDIQKQRPTQYQGIYIVSPEGVVLAGQAKEPAKGSWTRDLLDVLDAGLTAYGKVTTRKVAWRNPQPHRGIGVRKDGGIDLAVTTRHMLRGLDRSERSLPTFDRVEWTSAMVDGLSPADLRKGETWQVPTAAVKQLYGMLSANSDKTTLPRANELTRASLRARVERVKDGIAYLSFDGKLFGEHVGDSDPNEGKKLTSELTLTGVATSVARSGKLLSLTLVGDGAHRGYPPYNEPLRYGAVAEWVRSR